MGVELRSSAAQPSSVRVHLFAFQDADPDAVHGGKGLLNVKLAEPFALLEDANVPFNVYDSTPEPVPRVRRIRLRC